MVCDHILLVYRSVLFPFKQKGQIVSTDRPFRLNLSGETMASKPMRSCGLQLDVCKRLALVSIRCLCLSQSTTDAQWGQETMHFNLRKWATNKARTSLASRLILGTDIGV